MAARRRPRKPVRNPSHIVFPKKGAPYHVVEELPREQEDLELVLGRKFLGALSRFENIQLEGLARGTEPADLMCRLPDGTPIHLQVVEVIDQQLRELRDMRSSYRGALVDVLGDALRSFSGCRVSLVDSGDPPYLPRVTSSDGRECLRLLAEHIRMVGAEINTLEVRKIRNRRTRIGSAGRWVNVLVQRFVAAGEDVPFQFWWTGAGPSYRTDLPRGLVPAAVRSKIDKRYAKPSAATLWLLAYSVDTLMTEDDPDIAESQRLLSCSRHPFDDVWFIYPHASEDIGQLIHVWPTKTDG
jgi:hypothetical protein